MAEVDIIVPIYNVQDYLERNLKSLQEQTFRDIRILCVNDGSADSSAEVIDRFCQEDERFLRLDKENGGLSDARNFGLKHVSAPYVMMIDGDDFCEKEMVELSLRAIRENDSDIVVFPYKQYYLENDTSEVIPLRFKGTYSLKEKPELLAYTPNAAWNKLYRTSLFTENHIEYPFGYRHQDLGTTPKLLALAKKVTYIDTPLYNYLIDRPNNITRQVDNKIRHILAMCPEIVGWYKEKGLFEQYKEELNYLCTVNFTQSLRKAMKLTDAQFVKDFITDVFDFRKDTFGGLPQKYKTNEAKGDRVYLNKALCKAYYTFQRHKGELKV